MHSFCLACFAQPCFQCAFVCLVFIHSFVYNCSSVMFIVLWNAIDEYITIYLFCSRQTFCVFQFKAIISNFVRNFFLYALVHTSVGYILKIELWLYNIHTLKFPRYCQTVFQSGYTNLCYHKLIVYNSSSWYCLPLKVFSSWLFSSISLQFKFAFL